MSLELEEHLQTVETTWHTGWKGFCWDETDNKSDQKGNATCFSLLLISCISVVFSMIRPKQVVKDKQGCQNPVHSTSAHSKES